MSRSVKGKGKYYVHVPPQPTNYRQKSGGGPGGGRGVSGVQARVKGEVLGQVRGLNR